MKIQLQLNLGEIVWAVKDRLEKQGNRCLCLELGKVECTCEGGRQMIFQVIPVEREESGSLN
ncbi:MAG: hypothetical protein R3257_06555 [bacterium]|nr:hypothetical protein [bacterium]